MSWLKSKKIEQWTLQALGVSSSSKDASVNEDNQRVKDLERSLADIEKLASGYVLDMRRWQEENVQGLAALETMMAGSNNPRSAATLKALSSMQRVQRGLRETTVRSVEAMVSDRVMAPLSRLQAEVPALKKMLEARKDCLNEAESCSRRLESMRSSGYLEEPDSLAKTEAKLRNAQAALRAVSTAIAEKMQVVEERKQALLVSTAECMLTGNLHFHRHAADAQAPLTVQALPGAAGLLVELGLGVRLAAVSALSCLPQPVSLSDDLAATGAHIGRQLPEGKDSFSGSGSSGSPWDVRRSSGGTGLSRANSQALGSRLPSELALQPAPWAPEATFAAIHKSAAGSVAAGAPVRQSGDSNTQGMLLARPVPATPGNTSGFAAPSSATAAASASTPTPSYSSNLSAAAPAAAPPPVTPTPFNRPGALAGSVAAAASAAAAAGSGTPVPRPGAVSGSVAAAAAAGRSLAPPSAVVSSRPMRPGAGVVEADLLGLSTPTATSTPTAPAPAPQPVRAPAPAPAPALNASADFDAWAPKPVAAPAAAAPPAAGGNPTVSSFDFEW